MDQAQYWMLMKRREILKSHFQASMNTFNDSWEEKAFAEDAAGPLGGCMWPPRSYSCSFCKREFRSAQALGGHMNVHRRDRARLKQSLSPHNNDHDQVLHHQNHNQYPMKSFESHFPSEVCNLDPNYSVSSTTVASTTLSPSRVSALSTQENLSEHTFASPYSHSIVQELHNKVSTFSFSSSKPEVEKNPREEDYSTSHDDYVGTNLSMGLNLVVSRNHRPTESCGDEVIISCKRPKTAISTLPFFPSNDNYYPLRFEALGFKPSSMEDLDLELRLGDPPTVK